jgi:hypothetical protein
MSEKTYGRIVSLEDIATTEVKEKKYSEAIKTLVYLINDSDADIQFSINGNKEFFTLKPNESINNIPLPITYVTYKTSEGSGKFRLLGVN